MHATVRLVSSCLFVALACACLTACAQDPLEEVRALHEQGQYFESLEPLEALLDTTPDDPEAHYLYGVACLQSGRASLGVWSLRRAREFEGWELRAGLALARAALASDDFGTSIEAASRVLELDPEEIAALEVLAAARVGNREYEAGLADLDRLAEAGDDSGELELMRLHALIGLGRIDDAEGLFVELEKRRDSGELQLPEERYCATRGTFAAERGDPDRAREIFDACLEDYPANPLVLKSALDFFDRMRDPDRSLEILEQAIEQEPTAYQVREMLAVRLRDMEREEEAERVLLEGTELKIPQVAAMSWGALGVHYFQLGELEAALGAWEHLLELVPEPGETTLLAYAEVLALTGHHERALEVGARLPDAQREVLRGRVLLEQRRPEEASQAFAAAIRLWPDNPAARYFAAVAAERNGNFDLAISEYRDSLRSDAAATDAGLRLARLHAAEGKLSHALVALDHHLRSHRDDADAVALAYRLNMRLRGRGRADARSMLRHLGRTLGQRGLALAEYAKSVAAADGDAEAVEQLLRETEKLDLNRPELRPALRSLIEHLGRAGREQEALARAESALALAPEEPALHELKALALAQSGAGEEAVLAAHRRALELDPEHTASRWALARHSLEAGEPEAAREQYERALASAPLASAESVDIGLELAQLLLAQERDVEAKGRLEDLMWEHPFDARVAEQLAALEGDSDRGRELAERVKRFSPRAEQRG